MKKKYRFENWNVAFRHRNSDKIFSDNEFTMIKNPILFWAADPFVVHKNDEYYVFAELYNRITYRGDIRYCIIKSNGKVTKWRKALNIGSHLSFPCIYFENNEYYMMPESSKSGDLKIYKSKKFPKAWYEYKEIANNAKYADSIFLDEKHILTYDNYSRPRKMIILSNENNDWVMKDIMDDPMIIFRPAGKMFTYKNDTYIPFQDSSKGEYGGSFRISKIEINNGNITFLENAVIVNPETLKVDKIRKSSIIGVHTYNFDGDIEVIDVKELKFNLFSLIGYCIKKVFKR